MGGGVELPQGIDTPRVDELTQGDKNPGVPTKGDKVTGEDGQGRGGNGNPLTNQASKDSGDNSSNDGMAHGPRTAEAPRPQRDTAADNNIVGPLTRQSNGNDGARPKNG